MFTIEPKRPASTGEISDTIPDIELGIETLSKFDVEALPSPVSSDTSDYNADDEWDGRTSRDVRSTRGAYLSVQQPRRSERCNGNYRSCVRR